jgi:Glycosyl transferase 4-like domain
MKVAILGTRGIPASYSGFETAAEQLASRLTARGHEVTVYCRPHVVDRRLREWKGARLVHLPTLRNKYLDTFVHTFLSSLHRASTSSSSGAWSPRTTRTCSSRRSRVSTGRARGA